MEIIRGRLSSQDFSPPNLRYNPDTDMIEYSPDGGATWNPDPADDPRHSPKFAKVLKTGGDVRCDSAASMVEWIKQFIDYEKNLMVTGAEITGLANAVLLFFDLLAPWAILVNGLIDLAGTIFTVGATALETAFTDETYDLLQCCFYCNIGADGTVTIADFADLQAQVTTDLNTTAALIVGAILSAQGEMGVQNAGTLYDLSGDCSACECEHCFEIDFTVTDGVSLGWVDQGGDTWVDGVGWTGALTAFGGHDIYGYWAFGETVQVNQIEMQYSKDTGSGANNVNHFYALKPATGYNTTSIATNFFDTFGVNLTKGIDVNDELDGMGCDINSGTSANPCILEKMRVKYTGDIPAGWSDNC